MSSDPPNQHPLPARRTVWISLPPVHEQTREQFMADAADWQAFCDAVRSHYQGAELEAAERLIQEIPANINEDCVYLIFHLHRLRGVAVVSLTEDDRYATVRYLLSDGSEWGIGLSLLESAATLSQKRGRKGRLKLIAENDGLLAYYRGLCGFTILEPATMISGDVLRLVPSRAPQWSLHGTEWRLAANDAMATWR
jgi:hypothetical protein